MTPEDQPVTQQQLRDALDRAVETITAAIQTGAGQLRAEIQAAEDRAQESARAIETNLLTSFHGHAKGQASRLHTVEAAFLDTSTRIAALEERVLNIETRQRPPQ